MNIREKAGTAWNNSIHGCAPAVRSCAFPSENITAYFIFPVSHVRQHSSASAHIGGPGKCGGLDCDCIRQLKDAETMYGQEKVDDRYLDN